MLQCCIATISYQPLFTKGYNDLILRSHDELGTWQNYLRDNPLRLMMKRRLLSSCILALAICGIE